jgi:tryptophan synthase alpha chain
MPYVMAGDPDLATTDAILHELSACGADLIELGVPFSDPLADGPTIVAAGARATANDTTLARVLELLRRADVFAPVLIFTYYNLVLQYGLERFARDAACAGAAGAIVPDCPLEESLEMRSALHANALAMPLLVAPSTAPERAQRIADAATGFVYVVSRLGVTGAGRRPSLEPLQARLEMLRRITEKPLAVGFGLGSAEEIRKIAPFADGVVIGSALIDAYAGTSGRRAAGLVSSFARSLVAT